MIIIIKKSLSIKLKIINVITVQNLSLPEIKKIYGVSFKRNATFSVI